MDALPGDWRAFRAEFPAATRCVYLDVPAGLPMSRRAAEAGQRYFDDRLARADGAPRSWREDVDRVRAQAARLLNASVDEVAPIASAALALDLIARSIDAPAHIVAMADDDAGVPEAFVRHGHHVTLVESDADRVVAAQTIAAALQPETRAVVTSTILRGSGFRHDLGAVSRICRARGVPLIVDGSLSAGLVAIDVRAEGIDMLVFAMDAGAGMMYRPRGGSASVPAPALETIAPHAAGVAGVLALGGALDVVQEIGIARIEARVQDLTSHLHARLAAHEFSVASPRTPAQRAGITIIPIAEPAAAANRLREAGIIVGSCPRGVRVSLHACTSEADIDGAVEALVHLRRGEPIPARPAPAGPRVCVDLNGVLDDYEGWRGAEHWDPPYPGARDFLRTLAAEGYRVTVFTTRHYSGVWRWLQRHGMAEFVEEVTDRKPPADAFLDDHAIGFRGDFEAALRDLRSFRVHWARRQEPGVRS